jgi:carbamoyl-phosphate synthase large subunit
MPLDPLINKVLVIGAGPIVIGQACEFDYSGTQACKAIKEEGCKVILLNSNPATIMTDSHIADSVYIEPITIETIEKIIRRELPDSILPTMGGQTALNCAREIAKKGILKKYDINLIGLTIETIEKAENRKLFKAEMSKIGLEVPSSFCVANWKDVIVDQSKLSYPLIVRCSFTLGGQGGGIAHNFEELERICKEGFSFSKELLIEESLIGWKEYELEVVRDRKGNCIVVCGIENIDPMGIHTGDSITVTPIQTLTDKEYQLMRKRAFQVMEAIGMVSGGCNVQFAVDPKNGRMLCIEVNPRVSRSSAFASKATGFPIAKIATKIALGYNLDELRNDATFNSFPASFEPVVDYVVVKIPRFNFEKFPQTNQDLTTHMKSVGEVMAFGRTFKEALNKAISSLDIETVFTFSRIKYVTLFIAQINYLINEEKEIATIFFETIN